jgi:hypothetical protein
MLLTLQGIHYDLNIVQVNVKFFFCMVILMKNYICTNGKGFSKGKYHLIRELHKFIYGLKQASKVHQNNSYLIIVHF